VIDFCLGFTLAHMPTGVAVSADEVESLVEQVRRGQENGN